MPDDFECLELEQEGTIDLEQPGVLGAEECLELEIPVPVEPCEPLPCDVCFVNYCPVPVCVRPEIEEGVLPVSVNESNCLGVTKQGVRFKYPGVRMFNGDTSNIFNGSKDYPITLPLREADKIAFPLIQDARGQLKYYRPSTAAGNYKIISKDGSMRAVPDVFPSLSLEEGIQILPAGTDPPFFLAANATSLLCSDGPTTIQLLRISELPTPILPV